MRAGFRAWIWVAAAVCGLAAFCSGCGGSKPEAKGSGGNAQTPTVRKVIQASQSVDGEDRPEGLEALAVEGGAVRLWYADVGEAVAVRTVAPQTKRVILHIDRNGNDRLDPGIDKSYGAFANGTPCVRLETGGNEEGECGSAGGATVKVAAVGDSMETLWRIPKGELALGGVGLIVEVYDVDTQQRTRYPDKPRESVYGLRFTGAAFASAPVSPAKARSVESGKPPTQTQSAAAPPETPPANAQSPAASVKTDAGQHAAVAPAKVENGPPPTIELFTVEPGRISQGERVQLKWTVKGASSVRIEPGIGTVASEGTREETPRFSMQYTLTAVAESGVSAMVQRTVDVADKLQILSFRPSKPVIQINDTLTLFWETKGAAKISLSIKSFPPGADNVAETLAGKSLPISGKVDIRVDRQLFSRYGAYEFQLVAENSNGQQTQPKLISVTLR